MGSPKTDGLTAIADLAKRVRKHALMMTSRANASHIGSSLSSVDVLAMLYGKVMRYDPAKPDWAERDRFIMSKGHACSAVYSMLAECGFIGHDWLDTYCQDGARLNGHREQIRAPAQPVLRDEQMAGAGNGKELG